MDSDIIVKRDWGKFELGKGKLEIRNRVGGLDSVWSEKIRLGVGKVLFDSKVVGKGFRGQFDLRVLMSY